MKITTGKAAEITGGRLYGPSGFIINELVTDSRQTLIGEGTAFFAIKGKNHDGHRFISNLYNRGVRIFFVEDLPGNIKIFGDAAFIQTVSVIEALQLIASEKRKYFQGRVIGITGSTGKTIVKEWLAGILGSVKPVIRSPKSYNSQTGVPLSVWKLDNRFGYGIIEAGISMPGEMAKLQRIICPDTGIITNIGDAHSENFSGLREKASEKLKLFADAETVVYCKDQPVVRDLIENNPLFRSKILFSWSFSERNATVCAEKITSVPGKTLLRITSGGASFETEIPFTDRASVENAMSALTAALSLGVSPQVICNVLPRLASVAMRMEMKEGINGCLLIEDYYNSDPGSLRMAIEHLKSHNHRKSVLVLSDFIQTGRDERELYNEVAGLVNSMKIDRFIGIGPALCRNSDLFRMNAEFFESTGTFCRDLNTSTFEGDVILLKGARSFEFERISNLLSHRIHQTVLEINLDTISHNINEIRRHAGKNTKIMAMVKAFAYGAGPTGLVSLLEFHRVDYLAVAYADEGAELREAGASVPVVVMNPEPDAFDMMIRYSLEPEIYSMPLLKQFALTARRHGLREYPVHIKIDSGMHRLGFLPEETDELVTEIKESGSLKIASVFSHLAAAEDPTFDDFTHKQARIFKDTAEKIRKLVGYPFLLHLLNTAGIFRFPCYRFDMVRPGIGIYGIAGIKGTNLKQAGRFTTRILQLKKVPGGEPVGYGCTDVSDRERLIAILPVGYADGLSRRLGNGRGKFFIRNGFAPVVGNICMDTCMADVTGLDPHVGDEAEIFGDHITVEEIAALTDTIPYEILTSIPHRVKRIFTRE